MLNASAIEILNNLSKLLENEDIRVSLTHSGKSALITGLFTMAGGLMKGQFGASVGGLAGTLLSNYLTPSCVPLSQVVQSGLNEEDKSSLAQLLQNMLQSAPGATIAGAMANDSNKAAVIQTAMNFVLGKELVSARNSRNKQC